MTTKKKASETATTSSGTETMKKIEEIVERCFEKHLQKFNKDFETVHKVGADTLKALTVIHKLVDNKPVESKKGGESPAKVKDKGPPKPATAYLRFSNDLRKKFQTKFTEVVDKKERNALINQEIKKEWETNKDLQEKYLKEQEKLMEEHKLKKEQFLKQMNGEVDVCVASTSATVDNNSDGELKTQLTPTVVAGKKKRAPAVKKEPATAKPLSKGKNKKEDVESVFDTDTEIDDVLNMDDKE
jgi:hypothetical protein